LDNPLTIVLRGQEVLAAIGKRQQRKKRQYAESITSPGATHTATIDNDDNHDDYDDNNNRSPHPRQQKPPSKTMEDPFRSPSSLSLH
jgi:hypothetical protein